MQVNRLLSGSAAGFVLVMVAIVVLPWRSASADNNNQNVVQPLNPAGEGRRLFLRENCYGCHGGHGGGGMGPNFRDDRPNKDDVEHAVREGKKGGMPAFPGLTELDIQNLNAYIQSLRTPAEPVFTRWWEPVPSQ
jgi:cytochrome c551